jgi:hypothetical protein
MFTYRFVLLACLASDAKRIPRLQLEGYSPVSSPVYRLAFDPVLSGALSRHPPSPLAKLATNKKTLTGTAHNSNKNVQQISLSYV